MFIAGFAYYEIGRFDFSVGRDSVYLELMTGAFIMSMVSATISGYVQCLVQPICLSGCLPVRVSLC